MLVQNRLMPCSWPYKFVHALLRIVLKAGDLNLQAHTPAESVSGRDADGWITVKTPRGDVRAKTIIHATNRWSSHILPEFQNLILATRATLASLKAPEGFIRHTGAQHWDSVVNVSITSARMDRYLISSWKILTLTELPLPTSATV